MKLINNTNYRTDHLRAFVRRVAKEEMVDLKNSTFTFIYRRGNSERVAGFALIGMPARVTIKIRRDKPVDKVVLAYLLSHELCHSQGLHHRQMRNPRYSWRHGEWRSHYLWVAELPLDLKTVVEKIQPTSDQTIRLKLDRCLKRVSQWSVKVKRSQTLLKKWKQRAQYYTRRLKMVAENSITNENPN